MNHHSVHTLALIGTGSYGRVFTAHRVDNGEVVVVKQVSLAGMKPDMQLKTLEESRVMAAGGRPTVPQYCLTLNRVVLVAPCAHRLRAGDASPPRSEPPEHHQVFRLGACACGPAVSLSSVVPLLFAPFGLHPLTGGSPSHSQDIYNGSLEIFMEYARGGDLAALITRARDKGE